LKKVRKQIHSICQILLVRIQTGKPKLLSGDLRDMKRKEKTKTRLKGNNKKTKVKKRSQSQRSKRDTQQSKRNKAKFDNFFDLIQKTIN
jgi:hypothetical protein